MEIRETLKETMEKISFPEDAKSTFFEALDTFLNNPTTKEEFFSLLNEYEKDINCNYEAMLEKVASLGEGLGIHKYTSHMLLFLCMAEKLKQRYIDRGLDLELCYNTLCDLRYKLNECRIIHGIDGTFVAPWHKKIFNLSLFALGRLQFEYFSTHYEYNFKGKIYPKGTKVVNMHIPRTGGSLNHEEVLESYKLAEQMYKNKFGDEPLLFYCDSYLLDPWIPTVLSPTSNLTAFQNDFQIVKLGESFEYSGLWPIFACIYNGDISALPNDTTLRRAYIERIKENKPFYYGHGLFFYKNGEILK